MSYDPQLTAQREFAGLGKGMKTQVEPSQAVSIMLENKAVSPG